MAPFVKPADERPPRVDRLGLVGVGIGLLSLGATLLPVHPPTALPLAGWAVGAGCVLVAATSWLRGRTGTGRSRRTGAENRRSDCDRMLVLATDCSRLQAGIDELLLITGSGRGRGLGLRSRAEFDAAHEQELIRRYRGEFKQVVFEALEEAAAWCTVSNTSRRFAQGQSSAHIRQLPGVFADLEQQLMRSAKRLEAV